MSKRGNFAQQGNFMTGGMTAQEAAAGTWGREAEAEIDRMRLQKRERIELIALEEIRPDQQQPRRALPSTLRDLWNEPGQLFGEWMTQAEQESQQPVDIVALLSSEAHEQKDEVDDETEIKSPLARGLLALASLAGSIYREGLANPITVARSEAGGDSYLIETGERRWLAYNMLRVWQPDDERWQKIPCRIVETVDVWRQAAENNARQDLNAISKARQYAILVMDLHRKESSKRFKSYAGDDQAYYAQAVSLSPPYGRGQQVAGAMGFSALRTVKRYRDLLGLPNDLWKLADDYNAPERFLRELIPLPHHEATALFWQWVEKGGESGPMGPLSAQDGGETPKSSSRVGGQNNPIAKIWDKVFRGGELNPQRWQKLKPEYRRQSYEHLQTLLRQIEELGIDE